MSQINTNPPVFTSPTNTRRSSSWFQYSRWDGLLVGLACLQGMMVLLVLWSDSRGWWCIPAMIFLAVGLWWNANTISHNHLHNPFFRSRLVNRCFSLYLSLLLSIPQTLWKERHLWHHAGEPQPIGKKRWSGQKYLEFGIIGVLWLWLLLSAPIFFVCVFLPGYVLGLILCQMQGYYEHLGEAEPTAGVSYYGRLYNWIWLNDGFHIEHHQDPRRHWTQHPHVANMAQLHTSSSFLSQGSSRLRISAWPPFLRWIEPLSAFVRNLSCRFLGFLERSSFLWQPSQRWMIQRHQQAFRKLLDTENLLSTHTPPLRVGIVGGGLFPRTLLALHPLLPNSHFTLIDESTHSLEMAQQYLKQQGLPWAVEYRAERYCPQAHATFDILVFPLAYSGERHSIIQQPPVPLTFLHLWLWSAPTGKTATVSWWLAKQLTLLKRQDPSPAPIQTQVQE